MNELLWWTCVAALLLITDSALLWLGYRLFRALRTVPAAPRPERPAASPAALQADLDTLREAMEGLDDCLATVDRAMRGGRIAGTRATSLTDEDGARQRGYSIAHRLARKGADVQALMTDCGLSRGEAELIHNLHARAFGAGAVAGRPS